MNVTQSEKSIWCTVAPHCCKYTLCANWVSFRLTLLLSQLLCSVAQNEREMFLKIKLKNNFIPM